ncbi:tetratricopeptide repeat protein [Paenibacillus silviterrae]|uniref:tetratricopeptide repeat protein n=1 Tax=Paenibacillus silviterrae TaxID=3242194 RepID=UPI0025427B13|nr:tetratricopeptide repeat protein [Paenibacillus chinjuensis]
MNGEEAIRKAYASILMHDFEQAIAWFEQAIQLDPSNAVYHYKLSITYARSNKLERAIHHAGRAMELEPRDEHYQFHYQQLQARERVRQAEKLLEESENGHWMAVALLQEAIKLDPLALEAFLLLGIAKAQQQEFSDAIQAIKEVLKLDPQHSLGSRLLAEYQSKWKQYIEPIYPKQS